MLALACESEHDISIALDDPGINKIALLDEFKNFLSECLPQATANIEADKIIIKGVLLDKLREVLMEKQTPGYSFD